jgi:hypothetical protein
MSVAHALVALPGGFPFSHVIYPVLREDAAAMRERREWGIRTG